MNSYESTVSSDGSATIISIKLDTKRLSSKVLRVLKTAASIAVHNRQVQLHHVPIADFCEQAELPATTSWLQLRKLLSEASKVLGSIEVIEMDVQDQEEQGGSWPVFNWIGLSSSHISFELCRHMYLHEVQTTLLGSSPFHLALSGRARAKIGADSARTGHHLVPGQNQQPEGSSAG